MTKNKTIFNYFCWTYKRSLFLAVVMILLTIPSKVVFAEALARDCAQTANSGAEQCEACGGCWDATYGCESCDEINSRNDGGGNEGSTGEASNSSNTTTGGTENPGGSAGSNTNNNGSTSGTTQQDDDNENCNDINVMALLVMMTSASGGGKIVTELDCGYYVSHVVDPENGEGFTYYPVGHCTNSGKAYEFYTGFADVVKARVIANHDMDHDGIANCEDNDVDGDGYANWLDRDDDGDGVSDSDEVVNGTDPTDPNSN